MVKGEELEELGREELAGVPPDGEEVARRQRGCVSGVGRVSAPMMVKRREADYNELARSS